MCHIEEAESLWDPTSKESTPEDVRIASYVDFESDRSAVGRLGRILDEFVNSGEGPTPKASDREAVRARSGPIRTRDFGVVLRSKFDDK